MNDIFEINEWVPKCIGELLAEEIGVVAGREEFGVIARDIVPLNKDHFLSCLPVLMAQAKGKLRVALIGAAESVAEFQLKNPKYAPFVTADEETAVQWRNKNLKTIAVVSDGSLAKAASLKDFSTLDEQTLIYRLCDAERDKAEVVWLRTLWDALRSKRSPALPLETLARFAAILRKLPAGERSMMAPSKLAGLGLFPDSHLADEKTEAKIIKRLKFNAEMRGMVRNAMPEDWDRMSSFCRQLTGGEKPKFSSLKRKLKALYNNPALELDGLDLSDVHFLWKGKLRPGNGSMPGGEKDTTRVPVESKVAELILDGNTDGLSDIAEEIAQLAQAAENEQSIGEEEELKSAVNGGSEINSGSVVVSARGDIVTLCKSRSTSAEWGGVIEIESDRLDALTEVSAFKSWQPFLFSDFRHWLGEFVEAQLAPDICQNLVERLATSRVLLLKHIEGMAVSPAAVLAGNAEALQAAEEYLENYDQLLKQLQSSYQEMFSQAMDEAEQLIHWLLSMELYVYRRDSATEVLLSPIHPLNLWRSVQIVKDLQLLGKKLSDVERQTLLETAAEDVQLLNVLVLPKIASLDGQTKLLGNAGLVGHLPLFKEAPRGVLEPDGVKTVTYLSQLVAQLRPFVRPGLQVVFVNAPRPSRFIETLLDALDLDNATTDESYWGVHVRFRYTSEDTRGWTSELENLDDQLKDQIRQGQEKGLISLSIQPDAKKWPDVVDELSKLPAHLTVVFDPFEVRTSLISRVALHDLSPWMPTCEYRYNRLKKQIMVVPVAEEYIFATYFSTATLVHGELRSNTATHQPQVAQIQTWLDQMAKQSTWTVIADPHRVMLPRLGESEVIDRRTERARQITTFGEDLSPFVRRLDQQLRQTHFLAQPVTLEELIRDLVSMEPNGILGLVGGEKTKHVKGALGKLIAMRWYRRLDPTGLAVSLDTQNARRWLSAGGHSNEKADLLGLCEEGGELVIDVIEVKTHDEAVPYTVENRIVRGHAVDQVLSTLHALAEIFGSSSETPLAKPRREVLREHLYTALMRDPDPSHVERWHGLLQDLFNGNAKVKFRGRLIHVHLGSVAQSSRVTLNTSAGIPVQIDTLSAMDVGLVLTATHLVENDDLIPSVEGADDALTAEVEPSKALQLLQNVVMTRLSNRDKTEMVPGPTEKAGERSSQVGAVPEVDTNVSLVEKGNNAPLEVEAHHKQNLQVRLGEEVNLRSEVVWSPGKQSNGFFLILGASGSGKTETLKVLGKDIAAYGVPVLVLDFHGDVVFPGLKSVLLSSGTSSKVGINPLELDSKSAEETGLYDQRKVVRDMIRNAVPALGHRQNAILREALEDAYANAGFDDADPSTWNNRAPTFGDVATILSTWAEDDSRRVQRSAIEGCHAAIEEIFEHPLFHRQEHVSVDEILSTSIRLDLSKLSDEVRYICAETLLRKIFRVLRLKGPIPVQPIDDLQRFRLFIVIDEAKILSTGAGDSDAPDKILNLLFTEARKFGLGMILASQMSDHFGSEVKANAASWLVLKPMDIREARKNAPNVHMDPEALIALNGRGDGYLRDRTSTRARRIQVAPLSTAKGPDE